MKKYLLLSLVFLLQISQAHADEAHLQSLCNNVELTGGDLPFPFAAPVTMPEKPAFEQYQIEDTNLQISFYSFSAASGFNWVFVHEGSSIQARGVSSVKSDRAEGVLGDGRAEYEFMVDRIQVFLKTPDKCLRLRKL